MREFKFRYWDSALGEMDYEHRHYTGHHDGVTVEGVFADKDHSSDVWMQFTGLKDKNGIEIYEGDLLKQRYSNEKVYEVVWRKCGFELKYNFIRKYEGDSWEESVYVPIHNDSYEVIGNIYENPELLKGEQA